MPPFLERLRKLAAARAEEFAPGLPVKGRMKAIPVLKKPATWEFGEQAHAAERAGLHSDLRLSDGRTAFSWAVRKGIPAPGQKHLAIRQSDHAPSYVRWSGRIESPYGKGDVELRRAGAVKILSSSPGKISFALLDSKNPQRLSLIRSPEYGKDRWLLVNRTPTESSRPEAAAGKPRFRERSPVDLGRYLGDRYVLSSKIDGADVTVSLGDKGVEIFSHQPSASGELTDHTFVTGADDLKTPAGLRSTRLRAELFAVKNGKTLPLRTLGGLLNSAPEKALAQMEREGIRLYVAPFQVLAHDGRNMEGYPYKDHLKVLDSIVKKMPENWVRPDTAMSKASKERLISQIKSGKHPQTAEGVVAWAKDDVAATPIKFKFRDHSQVYVDEVFPMTSKGKALSMAGGFTYRLKPGGPVVGRVGTGFTMELRKDLWDNREKLKGRKVVVESAGQFPGGAYRAPSFVAFHP